jgi:PTH1 family peptidyl-tRNA hydrolase
VLARLRRLVAPDEEEAADDRGVLLVVGLGNPGDHYAGNRHNVGAWTVNRLAQRYRLAFKSTGRAALASSIISGREVTLAKPRAYVNESGHVVWDLVKRLKLNSPQELLVVCDELDLPVGKIRLRASGSHGGQRGLRSVIDALHSDNFPRLRIGIGRPLHRGQPSWEPDVVADYVLSDPPPDEHALLDQAVERAADTIEAVIADGVEQAMAQFN